MGRMRWCALTMMLKPGIHSERKRAARTGVPRIVLIALLAGIIALLPGLTLGVAPVGASVIDPNLDFLPRYQLDMTATMQGNDMLVFTVNLQHPPDDLWGLGSFRIAAGQDIEVTGGSGSGLYENCYRDDCGPSAIDWTINDDGSWTGRVAGTFDCTSNYSLYFTADVSYDVYFPRPDYANEYVQADGWGEAWANLVMPGDAVQCPSSPQPIVGASTRVTEGNTGTNPALVTIGLDAAPVATTSVNWSTSNNTARAGSDYSAASGTLTFAPGETSKSVTVNVLGDRLIEPDESFYINASSSFGSSSALVTIANDEPGVTLSTALTAEGDAGAHTAQVQATLSASLPVSTTLQYATGDGTATTATGDYQATSGAITIPAGQTSGFFAIAVNGDTRHEADETVLVSVRNTDSQVLASQALTIVDDDPPPALSAPSSLEGNTGSADLVFTVSLGRIYTIPVTFGYATTGGTATSGSDYTGASGTVVLVAGTTSASLPVKVIGDLIDEPDQSIGLTLTNGDGSTAASSLGMILDDDDPPSLTVDSPSVTEGNTASPNSLTFAVTLSTPSEFPVSFGYQAVGGTASTDDFFDTTGSTGISPGSLTTNVSVRVRSDSTFEPDETAFLALSSLTNATVGATQGFGTIINDDLPPALRINTPSVTEGNGGQTLLTFTVSVSSLSLLPASFRYHSMDVTAQSAQGDYESVDGTATVLAGQKSTTITIPVTGDTLYEFNEKVRLIISDPSNARINTTTNELRSLGTIKNDDAPPTADITDAGRPEGSSGSANLVFVVTLSAPSGTDAQIKFTTSDGTALSGSDYAARSGTLKIPAGETVGTIAIAVKGDLTPEPDETFAVTLLSPLRAVLGRSQADGSILNDD